MEGLDSILYRLAQTPDESLEPILEKLLPRLVGLLPEKETLETTQILGIFSHLNKRLQAAKTIQLPCKELLEYYNNDSSTLWTKNFALVYIEMGFSRLSNDNKRLLSPLLFQSLSTSSKSQQMKLLKVIVQAMDHMIVPLDETERKDLFPTLQSDKDTISADLEIVCDFCLDILLYSKDNKTKGVSLSEERLNRLASNQTDGRSNQDDGKIEEEKWLAMKLSCLNFLSSASFLHDNFKLLHFLVAKHDQHHEVVHRATDQLRYLVHIDYECNRFILNLMWFLLGTMQTDFQTSSMEEIPLVNVNRTPCNERIGQEILNHLCKSKLAIEREDLLLNIIFKSCFGKEVSSKLKASGMALAHWSLVHGRIEIVERFSPILFQLLVKNLIHFYHQNDPHHLLSDNGFREACYRTLSSIAVRLPVLVVNDISIPSMLFSALEIETSLRLSIYETLVSFGKGYATCRDALSAEFLIALRKLLLDRVTSKEHRVRKLVIDYVTEIFPFQDVFARYVCILLSTDEIRTNREAAQQGLVPKQDRMHLPNLTVYLEEIKKNNPEKDWICHHNPDIVAKIIDFSLVLLKNEKHHSAKKIKKNTFIIAKDDHDDDHDDDGGSGEYNDVNVDNNNKDVSMLNGCIELQDWSLEILKIYGWRSDQLPPALLVSASQCLVELLLEYEDCSLHLLSQLDPLLLNFLKDEHVQVRENFAIIVGMVVAKGIEKQEVLVLVKEMITCVQESIVSTTTFSAYNTLHGQISTLGEIVKRVMIHQKSLNPVNDSKMKGTNQMKMKMDLVLRNTLEKATKVLFHALSNKSKVVQRAVIQALGSIGKEGQFFITYNEDHCFKNHLLQSSKEEKKEEEKEKKEEEKEEEKEKEKEKENENEESVETMISILLDKIKPANDMKDIEMVVLALGRIVEGSPQSVFRLAILEGILALSHLRDDEEFHVTLGKALVSIAKTDSLDEESAQLGAKIYEKLWKFSPTTPITTPITTPTTVTWASFYCNPKEYILHHLLQVKLKDHSPHVRSSTSIYLLLFVCGIFTSSNEMASHHLESIHDAWIPLLRERSELTQECAARGLALVYKLASQETMQPQLLRSLMQDLSVNRSSISNTNAYVIYKELYDIVNDLQVPSLIYPLLYLSCQNAMWKMMSSCFEFEMIMTTRSTFDANANVNADINAKNLQEEMVGGSHVVERLLSKLFRYRYDPNEKIKEAMTTIWNVFVVNSTQFMEQHFDNLMISSLQNLSNPKHRIREASCKALVDLLSVKKKSCFEHLKTYVLDLWTLSLRVLDDVNEAVRGSALTLVKSIGELSVRFSDLQTAATKEEGFECVGMVLPFLINTGVIHPCAECRMVSLLYLCRIVKHSGDFLKPHLTTLPILLLESLSSLEVSELQYAQFHTESMNMSSEQLERFRLRISRSGPVQDTLDLCVQRIDGQVMEVLGPKLCTLIRSGVGLNTRAGTAHFIMSLSLTCPAELRPYSDKLLKAFLHQMSCDTSPSVVKAYSNGAAYVSRLAKSSAVTKYVQGVCEIYYQHHHHNKIIMSGSMDSRRVCGNALLDLFRISSNKAKENLKIILPKAFLARYDTEMDIATIWNTVWENCTEGRHGVLEVYTEEILEVIRDAFSASLWLTKTQGAVALVEMSKLIQGDLLVKYQDEVFPMLLAAIPGRVWDGKGKILEALVSFCKACCSCGPLSVSTNSISTNSISTNSISTNSISTNSPIPKQWSKKEMVDLLLVECEKEDVVYKKSAIASIGELSLVFPTDSVFEQVYPFFKELLSREEQKKLDPLVEASIYHTLGQAWPTCNRDDNDSSSCASSSCASSSSSCASSSSSCASSSSSCASSLAVQKLYIEEFVLLLCKGIESATVWRIRVSCLEALQKVAIKTFARVVENSSERTTTFFHEEVWTSSLIDKIVNVSLGSAENAKYWQVRVAGLDVLLSFLQRKELMLELLVFKENIHSRALHLSTTDGESKVCKLATHILQVLVEYP